MSGQPSRDLVKNQDQSRSHGGKRPGAGRRVGAVNKATAPIREIAKQYSLEAIDALVRVLRDDDAPHAAVIGASNAILDRAHGRPSQVISGDDDNPLKVVHVIEIIGVPAR